MRSVAGTLVAVGLLLTLSYVGTTSVQAEPPIDQAGVVVQQVSGDLLLQRTNGCVTTEVFVSVSRNVVAGFPYTSGHFGDFGAEAGDHLDDVYLGGSESDTCNGQLLRSWGTVSWSGSLAFSRHAVSATTVVTVQECVQVPDYECTVRDVAIDLTWIIVAPAFENVVDTTNDIHGGGVVSNQGSKTFSSTVSGSVDGEAIGNWPVALAQVNSGHQAGLVHNPVP
jgi:hypothetical protein